MKYYYLLLWLIYCVASSLCWFQLIGEEILPILEGLDPSDSNFVSFYRSIYGVLCHGGQLYPAVITDNIGNASDTDITWSLLYLRNWSMTVLLVCIRTSAGAVFAVINGDVKHSDVYARRMNVSQWETFFWSQRGRPLSLRYDVQERMPYVVKIHC